MLRFPVLGWMQFGICFSVDSDAFLGVRVLDARFAGLHVSNALISVFDFKSCRFRVALLMRVQVVCLMGWV